MTDTPPSDGPSQGAEFDMMGALDWKDGIATLPGSDIRFRMTEFGTLEIVTDLEVKGQEAVSNRETLDPAPSHTPTPPPEAQSQTGSATAPANQIKTGSTQTKEGSSMEAPNVEVGPSQDVGSNAETGSKGELLRCRACGGRVSGVALFQGKFCSSACAQPSSGRSSPAQERENPAVEGLGKRVRKKRKIYMDSGDEEEDNQEEPEEKAKSTKSRRGAKIAKLVSTPPNKKRAWSWPSYLEEERATGAPVKLFKEHQSFPQSRNSFKVGMKLEGLDPSHPSLFCVLTVAEIQGYRVRLHFDGYPECHDFWANADSWDMKPAGWCEKNGHKLLLPKGCKEGEFNWSMYVKNCRGQLAPKHLFKSLNTSVTPSGFRAGMKLEAANRRNPQSICVATIAAVVDNRLLIHFDDWDDTHDYWCDASSPYIHPVGFCEEVGLTLTTPNDSVSHCGNAPMMNILDPSMFSKWENLRNHRVIKYLLTSLDVEVSLGKTLNPALPLVEGIFRGVCKNIDHFPDDADYEQDAAEYLLRAVRASSLFPILSVGLLFLGGVCVAASEFYKSRYNVILTAGILFVSAGLSNIIGIIVYISANSGDPSQSDNKKSYSYGWSFYFGALSFVLAEIVGVLAVHVFIERHRQLRTNGRPSLIKPPISRNSSYYRDRYYQNRSRRCSHKSTHSTGDANSNTYQAPLVNDRVPSVSPDTKVAVMAGLQTPMMLDSEFMLYTLTSPLKDGRITMSLDDLTTSVAHNNTEMLPGNTASSRRTTPV